MLTEEGVTALPLNTTAFGGSLARTTDKIRLIFSQTKERFKKPVVEVVAVAAAVAITTEPHSFKVLSFCRSCKQGRASDRMTHCFDCGEPVCEECDVYTEVKKCACTRQSAAS